MLTIGALFAHRLYYLLPEQCLQIESLGALLLHHFYQLPIHCRQVALKCVLYALYTNFMLLAKRGNLRRNVQADDGFLVQFNLLAGADAAHHDITHPTTLCLFQQPRLQGGNCIVEFSGCAIQAGLRRYTGGNRSIGARELLLRSLSRQFFIFLQHTKYAPSDCALTLEGHVVGTKTQKPFFFQCKRAHLEIQFLEVTLLHTHRSLCHCLLRRGERSEVFGMQLRQRDRQARHHSVHRL
mmetsp:Transcript_11014/g.17439  ORF Transcript_11014/g.17439 Transcript_11014/m.17439 type:complete len:239 (-) Transcript_11014:1048-1764(-)